jgi:hypothetical protein
MLCILGGAAGVLLSPGARAQELNARVTVLSSKIRGVDASVFKSLQKEVQDFLNTRQWTDKSYDPSERIDCNVLLDLQRRVSDDVFSGTLTVQSTRPVYNSSYSTTLLNFKDKDLAFKYDAFQPLEYSDTRVAGNDPLVANLTAILAFYAYVVIGLDQDSFSPSGGLASFKKAQNVVTNAPSNSSAISGWKAFEGTRNRYWMAENLLNTRYKSFHDILYEYHLKGLDQMYDHAREGRQSILECLNKLNALYADNPTTMILPMFFDAKSQELAGVFSKAPGEERTQALNLLQKLDPGHGAVYRENLTK